MHTSVLRFAFALLVLLLAAPAMAIEGGGPVRMLDGAREQRIETPSVQQDLDASAAWQDFQARHPGRWTARWDEATGTPVRFYGEGWAIDSARLASDPFGLSRSILGAERDLLGVEPQSLDDGVAVTRQGVTTVSFLQRFSGLPVEDARISLRFKAGRFVMGQFESFPGIAVATAPIRSAAEAVSSGLAALDRSPANTEVAVAPRLVVRPLPTRDSVDHRLAWRFELKALDRPSYRIVWVDAHAGDLLGWEELVRFADGTVEGEHDNRYPLNGLTTSPLRGVALSGGSASATSDFAGNFSISTATPVDLSFNTDGTWIDLRSLDNSGQTTFQSSLNNDGGTVTAQPSGGNQAVRRQRAQVQAHVALHTVRDRAVQINPSFSWAQSAAIVRVNMNDMVCNAWYDEQSRLNFVVQDGGCNNTARIADVIYHEYGHGWHWWNLVDGSGNFEGALSEGLSDYMSATITNEAAMGRNFVTGTTSPLRDLEDFLVWPTDIDEDPHITGLIIGGALWDLREAMISAHGIAAGVQQTDHIFWGISSNASDIPSSYEEALLVDDDDGNLSNGTPNQCHIETAFGPHGLGPGVAIPAYYLDHEGLEPGLAPDQSIDIDIEAGIANAECASGAITSAVLHYSVDDDEPMNTWDTLNMVAGAGDLFSAAIPGAAPGTYVRYWVETFAEDGGQEDVAPLGSITDPWFGAWVGGADVHFETDFEADDGGFTHELLSGNPDTLGSDDWQWGPPGGVGGDPDSAWSGNNAWGNDLAPEDNWNGQYQDNVHNVLASPTINVGSATPVYLQFRRWLQVEDGFWDDAEVHVNGELVWTQFSSPVQDGSDQHHDDAHWAFRSYDITDLVGPTGNVEVQWHLVSDAGLTRGGWNIDDVRVITPNGDIVDPGDDDDATDPGDDDDVADDDDDSTAQQDDDDAVDDDDDAADDDDATADTPFQEGSSSFAASGSACSCTTADRAPGGGLLGLLLLLGLRRRRG